LVGQPREPTDKAASVVRKLSKLPELDGEADERMSSFICFQLVDNARALSAMLCNGVESEAKITESRGFGGGLSTRERRSGFFVSTEPTCSAIRL
jgi:hypothetical protein